MPTTQTNTDGPTHNTNSFRPVRRAWSAAATLGHATGNTIGVIFILAETKADAIAAAIHQAAQGLPGAVGDNYGVINSHATPVAPEVLRAAIDEIETAETPHG